MVQQNRATTGITGLDQILRGGFPRDHIYLVEGDPGVGKTTLALQFLLDGRGHGETGLYITLSETDAEIREVAASHGWSLDGIELLELSSLDQAKELAEENTLFDPSEVDLKETMEGLLAKVETIGPSRVVFDSLSEIRLLAQSPLRYRRQILQLKQYFAGKHSTVLLLDDRTAQPGDQQVESIAHGVIALQQVAPEYGDDRRRLRVRKLRGIKFLGGHHDFVINSGGLEVFPRLAASNHLANFEHRPLPSGNAELDRLLGGGIDRGTSTLIAGPAGTGKSIIASQFAHAATARGEKVAMFLFEESIRGMLARASNLGMNLSEQVQKGNLFLQRVDPAEIGAGELAFRARQLLENQGVELLIIDSLNGLVNAMPEERFLAMQLHEMLAFLSQNGVSTLMVMAHSGMFGPMQTPVDVSYLADSVLLLRHFEAAGQIRKAISVIKKRTGPHESTIRELTLRSTGVEIGAPLEQFTGVLTGVPIFTGDQRRLALKS